MCVRVRVCVWTHWRVKMREEIYMVCCDIILVKYGTYWLYFRSYLKITKNDYTLLYKAWHGTAIRRIAVHKTKLSKRLVLFDRYWLVLGPEYLYSRILLSLCVAWVYVWCSPNWNFLEISQRLQSVWRYLLDIGDRQWSVRWNFESVLWGTHCRTYGDKEVLEDSRTTPDTPNRSVRHPAAATSCKKQKGADQRFFLNGGTFCVLFYR